MKLDIDDEGYWYVSDWIESKARTPDDGRRVGELVSALAWRSWYGQWAGSYLLEDTTKAMVWATGEIVVVAQYLVTGDDVEYFTVSGIYYRDELDTDDDAQADLPSRR